MVKVLITTPFKDKYTGKVYEANKEMVISKERAKEIMAINPDLIIVLAEVEEPVEEVEEPEKKGSK